jgi:hypothetical protein
MASHLKGVHNLITKVDARLPVERVGRVYPRWCPRKLLGTTSQDAARGRQLERPRIKNCLDALLSSLVPKVLVSVEMSRISNQSTADGPPVDEHLREKGVVLAANPEVGAERVAYRA